jgi:hypothetical protein
MSPQQPKPIAKPREQTAKPREQPKQGIIKVALKELFSPNGEPDQKVGTHIVIKRVERWLTDHGYEDVRVTRSTLERAIGRRK